MTTSARSVDYCCGTYTRADVVIGSYKLFPLPLLRWAACSAAPAIHMSTLVKAAKKV